MKSQERELDKLVESMLPILSSQNRLLDLRSRYLMKRDWDKVVELGRATKKAPSHISERIRNKHGESTAIQVFLDHQRSSTVREERNERFKERERETCAALFDDIDGRKLDPQQVDAILTDESSNLIIAGAGSGKTLTIVGKLRYSVERWRVAPEKILGTSFTRKSVHELAERIERSAIKNVSCRTFHSIGYELLEHASLANGNLLRRRSI